MGAVSLAVANFSQNNTDKKAMLLPEYNSAAGIVCQKSISVYPNCFLISRIAGWSDGNGIL